MLFDVIEHVKDFRKMLKFFRYWLKPQGTVVITTPDIKSWDARLLGENWDSFHKIPEHIYFFSPYALSLVLQEEGFGSVKVINWGFVRSIGFVMEKEFWGKEEGALLITIVCMGKLILK